MYNNDNILIEQLGIDLFAGESLCEFATVARDYTNNLTVAVNPDSRRKFGNSQYFKVYDSSEPKKQVIYLELNLERMNILFILIQKI